MSIYNVIYAQDAMVIKQVIDLIPTKMLSIYNNLNYYNEIPLSPVSKIDLKSCPRVHQLLFNEKVKIIKTEKDEVIIEVPQLFYQNNINDTKHNTFWTMKKNLITFDELEKKSLDKTKFPINQDSKVLILLFPYTNDLTDETYSAGTKFIYEEIENNEKEYLIFIFNSIKNNFDEIKIPKKFCLTINYSKDLSFEKKRQNFVNILKKWANLKHGFIPYVWGGCSFCQISEAAEFQKIQKNYEKSKINFFEFSDYNYNPKTGYDCAGLIVNAAKIAQIYFPFKNTTTISKNLKSLEKDDELKEGDLIWIPGHIIVITNIPNNLCVESRGYLNNGAGKVQEIELKKLFKKIDNFDILKNHYFDKKKLERLDMKNNVFEIINSFKILKLNSV